MRAIYEFTSLDRQFRKVMADYLLIERPGRPVLTNGKRLSPQTERRKWSPGAKRSSSFGRRLRKLNETRSAPLQSLQSDVCGFRVEDNRPMIKLHAALCLPHQGRFAR